MTRLVAALERHGISLQQGDSDRRDGVLLLVGGTIPDADVPALQAMGVDGVFPVGSFTGQMVDFIRQSLTER